LNKHPASIMLIKSDNKNLLKILLKPANNHIVIWLSILCYNICFLKQTLLNKAAIQKQRINNVNL